MDRKLKCPWNRAITGGDIVRVSRVFSLSSLCQRLPLHSCFCDSRWFAGTGCVLCSSAPLAGPLRLHVYCVFEEIV